MAAVGLWIASYGAGMAVREGGRWTLLDTRSGLPSNVEVFTKGQAEDGSEMLWVGTEGGLLRFEHGQWTLYDERSGMPIRIVWKVLETTAPGGLKTLWLGTWGGGVLRLSPNAWKSFDASSGMPAGAVTSMLLSKDAQGREVVWVGTSDGGLARTVGRALRGGGDAGGAAARDRVYAAGDEGRRRFAFAVGGFLRRRHRALRARPLVGDRAGACCRTSASITCCARRRPTAAR